MGEREWDEAEDKKFHFAEEVETEFGIGKVCELEGDKYHVYGQEELGWFTADELKRV